MDPAARRREARRRRLLQDPEERLQKIRNLNESSQKKSETSEVHLSSSKQSSPSSPTQNQPVSDGEDALLCETPDIDKQFANIEHSYVRTSGSVSPALPAGQKTLEGRKQLQKDRKRTIGTLDSSPASDSLNYSPGLLTIQKFFVEFQNFNSSTSSKTAVACVIAIVFRLSLELEWLTFFTGKSMVVIFLMVYLPWLYFWELSKVKIESLPGALFFSFTVIQDFAFYLFAFVVTHGFVTVFTGTCIAEDDQIDKYNLT